uniref:Maf family protein n=1 Tax=Orrella sp. TaxID=1921583 RepID=UPI0040480D9B
MSVLQTTDRPPPLILASSSPYRSEMLSRLGLPFKTEAPEIDERREIGETPKSTARRLALQKSLKILLHQPDAVVIGADQVLDIDGQTLGKPGSHEAAVRQLTRLSGRAVTFYSALAVVCASGRQISVIECHALFKPLTLSQIERYLTIERPFDVAGSARAEGLGISLLDKLTSDDPTAIIGLPLIQLTAMLSRAGHNPLNQHVLSQP